MTSLDIYGELIKIYDLEHNILLYKNDTKQQTKINEILRSYSTLPYYAICFKIINKNDFLYNDLNITYTYFPWKCYYKNNSELLSNTHKNNKNNAWNHWITYGKNEERAFSYINNTNIHRARFGNLFFLNMCLHLFSIKFDLKSSYKYENMFNRLGIYFHRGNKTYHKNILLTDYNFVNLLKSDISPKNIIISNNVWFHTHEFCKIIQIYFKKNDIFKRIYNTNIYKKRYNNNNDLFIHVRLDDVENITKYLIRYYEDTINSIEYKRGYIISDNFNHPMCNYLIDVYKLIVINKDEIHSIMFGSTCKHIVLSGGTFSWLIGFLSNKSSNIYYPEIKNKWYGDIFSFFNWYKIIV